MKGIANTPAPLHLINCWGKQMRNYCYSLPPPFLQLFSVHRSCFTESSTRYTVSVPCTSGWLERHINYKKVITAQPICTRIHQHCPIYLLATEMSWAPAYVRMDCKPYLCSPSEMGLVACMQPTVWNVAFEGKESPSELETRPHHARNQSINVFIRAQIYAELYSGQVPGLSCK